MISEHDIGKMTLYPIYTKFHCWLGLAGHGQEQLEFGGQLVLCVEAIGEVDSSDPAVRVNLHSIIDY